VLGFLCPTTGSTTARRRISRRIGAVTRRTWPLIQTQNTATSALRRALVIWL
jgi:hypothetical protein